MTAAGATPTRRERVLPHMMRSGRIFPTLLMASEPDFAVLTSARWKGPTWLGGPLDPCGRSRRLSWRMRAPEFAVSHRERHGWGAGGDDAPRVSQGAGRLSSCCICRNDLGTT